MRKFSKHNCLQTLLGLVVLQLPWLFGLIPIYSWFGLDKPVGGLIWLYGFLYNLYGCIALLLLVFIIFVGVFVSLALFNYLFPEEVK